MKFGVKKNGRSTGGKLESEGKITLPMILASHSSTQVDFHTPVLLPKIIEELKIQKGSKYIDATLGGGGYAFEILRRGGKVLGIDCDEEAIRFVKDKFKNGNEVFLERGNFADLKKIAGTYGFERVAGIIFDLGMSSFQLERSKRGFSFKRDEPLDMRMDQRSSFKAYDIINSSSEQELYEIFAKFSEEIHSRTIAHALFRARSLNGPIETTGQLHKLIENVMRMIPAGTGRSDAWGQEATQARIFQALRIAVNDELEHLKKGLGEAISLLGSKGKLAVLSYHSLEDRIVKRQFKGAERKGILRIVNKEPIRAQKEDIRINPKSRSVKLRIGEKI